MILITDCDEKCFALGKFNECKALVRREKDCGSACPFYKPKGCKDWIRLNDKLYEPEELKLGKGN